MMKNLTYLLIFPLLMGCQPSQKNENTIQNSDTIEANLFYKIDAQLGEGPIWNHLTQQLYWVDIEGKLLHILNPETKENRSIAMPTQVGTVVPIDPTRVVVALVNGAFLLDTKTEDLSRIASLDSANGGTRLNDGKCDPAGRLWVGSMHWDTTAPIGGLFMLEGDGSSQQKLDSITVSNGIVWSGDHKTMYYIDTPTGKVQAFDFDVTTGEISNGRTAVEIPKEMGSPDGMAIDAEDKLWIGLWNGNSVVRYDPLTGDLLKQIPIPAHNVTACAFGGKNLDSLFVTTARIDMTEEELEKYPDAGSIFVLDPGVKGVESDFFKLAE